MNTRALVFTLLIAGSAVLGLYFCSKTGITASSQTVNPVKEVKQQIKYYTADKSGGFPFYEGLYAKIGDKKYTIIKGGDEGEGKCIQIFNTKDYDSDGYEDALITNVLGCGGNCCLESYSFCSYSKNGKFILSEEFGYTSEDPIIEKWKGKKSVKVKSVTVGMTTDMSEKTERFILENGKAVLVESKNKMPLKAIIEMKSADLENTDPDIGKKLFFDLDEDGAKDFILGKYWDRWGSMFWSVKFANGKAYETSEGIKRIGVLSSKTNGVHDLVLDFDDIIIWDGAKYKDKNK